MDFQHKIDLLKAQPTSYWIGLVNTRLPEVTSIILLLLIAFYLARFVWALVPLQQEFDWTVKPAATTASGPAAAANQVNYRTIVAAHLFGEAGLEPVVNKAIDAPETRLNLKLRGAVAAEDDSLAHAIIADGNGKDDVYFINDSVPGGAKLHQVYPDRVILNRSGSLETLRLPKIIEGSKPTSRAASSRPVAAPEPDIDDTSVAQLMTEGPASFTDVLRPQPYMPNGQLKGYRVYPGRDRRRFSALGLRPGDLVTDINGQPLDNLQSGMDVFRSLGNATQITVTIERNGSPMSLTLDTKQLTESAGNTQ